MGVLDAIPFLLVATPPEDTTTTTAVATLPYGADPAADAATFGWPILIFLLAVLVTYTVAR